MTREEENRMKCTKAKYVAGALAFLSAALIISSFFVPPMGTIDGSVLAAVGELFGFAALFAAWEAVDRGIDAKVTHGNTTIELNNPDNKSANERAQA